MSIRRVVAMSIGATVALAFCWLVLAEPFKLQAQKPPEQAPERERPKAPSLEGGVAWLNTAGPIKLDDLKGKVVLLDFWTLCCINCIHIMPDLAKLEKKYPNQLVVIGVHSAKFENEKDTKSIKQAILRYEIAHPVVNDADHKIWNRYEANSWPTFVVIDPEGRYVGYTTGEGNYETLDKTIADIIAVHKAKGTLDDKPIRFDLVRYRETADTPLFYPGKVLADAKSDSLFIADSTHHRIVVTSLSGKMKLIAGTGSPGFKDGPAAEATFDDPQGMALDGDLLYIADRKNHSLRTLNVKTGEVKTVAGNGKQDGGFERRRMQTPVDPLSLGLNSPWDLLIHNRTLYIAMAGHHQIWTMDLDKKKIKPFAGTGRENILDGPLYAANLAQPSGLATDGKYLYVADSEVSAIRKIPLDGNGSVETLVGEGLFEFGDIDGNRKKARLQHALAVAYLDGQLIVADTYNSKIKKLDTGEDGTLKSWLGHPESWFADSPFSEPAGLSVANGKIYVADTNANRIRVIDAKTGAVSTLTLEGVTPPPPQKEWQKPK